MHPGSKDYTQRVIAWSILLDGDLCRLVEEFLRLFQFERKDSLSLWERARVRVLAGTSNSTILFRARLSLARPG